MVDVSRAVGSLARFVAAGFFGFASLLVATGVGASFGAWVAFRLQSSRVSRDKRQTMVDAGRWAQFCLTEHATFLHNVKRQQLDTHSDDDEAWQKIPWLITYGVERGIDVHSLCFLLETDDPNLLQELGFADADFRTFTRDLEARNAFVREYQDRLEVLRRNDAKFPSEEAFVDAVGFNLVKSLKDLTGMLFEANKRAIASNDRAFKGLTQALIKMFPDEKISPGRDFTPEGYGDARLGVAPDGDGVNQSAV